MIKVDPEFFNIIQRSHSIAALAKIYTADVDTKVTLKITEGKITADRSQQARRSLDCTMVINSWENPPIDVLKSRLQVFIGVYNAFNVIWLPVGVFRVDSMGRTNDSSISVNCVSLEAYVIDNLFESTRSFTKTTSTIAEIKKLVNESFAETVVWETDAEQIALGLTPPTDATAIDAAPIDRDRWEAVEMLSRKINADTYCGPDGKFRIRKRVRLYDAKVIGKLTEGPDGVLIRMNTQVSRDDVYNAVMAMGQSTTTDVAPVSAIIKDDKDVKSPTYWGGPFGKKIYFYESSQLLSTVDCVNYAKAMLEQFKSEVRTVDFSATPNAAIEPDDVFEIELSDGSKEKHMIENFTIPLGTGEWTAKTLAARIADPLPEP